MTCAQQSASASVRRISIALAAVVGPLAAVDAHAHPPVLPLFFGGSLQAPEDEARVGRTLQGMGTLMPASARAADLVIRLDQSGRFEQAAVVAPVGQPVRLVVVNGDHQSHRIMLRRADLEHDEVRTALLFTVPAKARRQEVMRFEKAGRIELLVSTIGHLVGEREGGTLIIEVQ